jgi:exonuclease III
MCAPLNNSHQSLLRTCSNLLIISYNMHGYNQGLITLNDLVVNKDPDVILLQEHWFTPDNLKRFINDFEDYYSFGSAAMDNVVSSGPLYGRPYGGTMILLKNNFMPVSNCVYASERFVIVKIGDLICINVYFPCVGTVDRQFICEEMLSDIWSWRNKYPDCGCVIGGDFNADLSASCGFSKLISNSLLENDFVRCDSNFLLPLTIGLPM